MTNAFFRGTRTLLVVRVLAVDPSSTTTGVALCTVENVVAVREIRPRRTDLPLVRIRASVVELVRMVGEWKPDLAVIEIPEGNAKGIKISHSAVATCSLAAGYYLAHLEAAGLTCLTVKPSVWTNRRTKTTRIEEAALVLGVYPDHEKWSDGLDAAALGMWWFEQDRAKDPVTIVTRATCRELEIAPP